ncbi:MAG: hypothetical protein SOZ29_08855 [Prevotella sp.]|nr:hypothetical protein [Prevotella sp.]
MKTEENKRMLALACTVADLKTENMYLAQRVQELVDEYNNVANQLVVKQKRNEKDSSTKTNDEMLQTLAELQQMREQCEHLERENRELKRFAKEIHTFVKDKNLYVEKDKKCPYHPGGIPVCSTPCLECDSCLGVIEGVGVICRERLKEAEVSLPENE